MSEQLCRLLLENGLESFIKVCKAAAIIRDYATFSIDMEGMHYREINDERTCLLEINLPASSFSLFQVYPTRFTLQTREMVRRLNRGKDDDNLEISIHQKDVCFSFGLERNKRYVINTVEEDYWFGDKLNISHNVKLTIDAKALREIFSDVAIESNEVIVKSFNEVVELMGKSEKGEALTGIRSTSRFVYGLEIFSESTSCYALEPMLEFIDAVQPRVITLQYSSNSPIMLSCALPKNVVQLSFYEAPIVIEGQKI